MELSRGSLAAKHSDNVSSTRHSSSAMGGRRGAGPADGNGILTGGGSLRHEDFEAVGCPWILLSLCIFSWSPGNQSLLRLERLTMEATPHVVGAIGSDMRPIG